MCVVLNVNYALINYLFIFKYSTKHLYESWVSIRKEGRTDQGFKPVITLNPSRYH